MQDLELMSQLSVNAFVATVFGYLSINKPLTKSMLLKYIVLPFAPIGLWVYVSSFHDIKNDIGSVCIFFAGYLGIFFFNVIFWHSKKIDEKMAKENRVLNLFE